ncbi:hypothetical protein F0562_030919 [Nyssa sinensis]|uniref:Uncharacterized protein n=1 Tax=Nyssa sinensis TaxID=561372 RepID=A0A5J5AVZ8_9ASTE|nr:hypothetical protein F0562_030919 [Nyssa sinensis]
MMGLDEKSFNVDMGMNSEGVDDKENVVCEVGSKRELEYCRNRCFELEERSKKAEERCTTLEMDVQKKMSEFELLEGKLKALDVEKIALEDELRVLKKRNDELEEWVTQVENENKVAHEGVRGMGRIIDLVDENGEAQKVVQLMIENKVLDCEKKRAESEVDVWKAKCGELELRVLELQKGSLVFREGRHSLPEKMNMGLGLPELVARENSETSELQDILGVRTSLEHLQTEEQVLDSGETTHAAGPGLTCYSPVKGIGDLQTAVGTSSIDMPSKQSVHAEGGKRGVLFEMGQHCGSQVRKQLAFGEEGSPNKKMAPSTPGGARPASVGVIDVSDSDDEPVITNFHIPSLEIQGNKMFCGSNDGALGCTMGNEKEMISNNNLKKTLLCQSDDEDKGNFPYILTPKRKKASNIVTSDSESDDDNVPICKLRRKHVQELYHGPTDSHLNSCSVTETVSGDKVQESVTRRRRLVTLRECEVKDGPERNSPSNLKTSETKYHPGMATNEDVENDEMEEDGSMSEGESLGGFIVDSSDVSDCDNVSSESEDVSDANMDFDEVISRIQRNRHHKSKWEFEADMLAGFGKNPELCMKAVCALYRQQTSEEKLSKGTIYSNRRGFSQCDALRGTTLAEFLTDGDPKGDVNKSVEELQQYNPKGLELCRTLATRYSKQLFAIYKNKEDPLFLPD